MPTDPVRGVSLRERLWRVLLYLGLVCPEPLSCRASSASGHFRCDKRRGHEGPHRQCLASGTVMWGERRETR